MFSKSVEWLKASGQRVNINCAVHFSDLLFSGEMCTAVEMQHLQPKRRETWKQIIRVNVCQHVFSFCSYRKDICFFILARHSLVSSLAADYFLKKKKNQIDDHCVNHCSADMLYLWVKWISHCAAQKEEPFFIFRNHQILWTLHRVSICIICLVCQSHVYTLIWSSVRLLYWF